MSHILLVQHALLHDAVQEKPYRADILAEDGKITRIVPAIDAEIGRASCRERV